jgi:hypothetical protein
MAIESFSIPFSQTAVDDLRDRLARMRWPDEISTANWEYGVNLSFIVSRLRNRTASIQNNPEY